MKLLLQQIWCLFVLLLTISSLTIGCISEFSETPTLEAAGTSASETIEAGVALTVAAIASETFIAEAKAAELATKVAETVTAIIALIPEETPTISIIDMQTSIAGTIIAQSPTLAPSPAISATPTSIMIPQIRVTERVARLNVRLWPNTCFDVVTTLDQGQVTTVIGRDNSHSWYKVQLENAQSGWVWADYVELVDQNLIDQIPVITSLPYCPTLTPTNTPTNIPPSPIPPQKTKRPPQPTAVPVPTNYPSQPTIAPTPTVRPCSYPPCP